MSAEETFTYRFGPADGETNLVQIDIANGEETPVTAGPGVKEYPSVLPSGEVAYVRRQSPVQGVFYASGKPGPAGSDLRAPSWSPDGTDVRQLTNTPGNEAHLAWSPDGQRLAFASTRMGFKDEALYSGAPQPYGEIFVMRYDGTQVEQLTDNQWEDGGPAWQPRNPNSTAATARSK
jgi:TolB protein